LHFSLDTAQAVLESNAQCTAMLIAGGATIDARSSDGLTPLIMAAAGENLDLFTLLLDAGSDIEAQTKLRGVRPLMAAAMSGNVEMVALLLDRGADVGAVDQSGYTASMLAQMSGQSAAHAILLEREEAARTQV
jgi:ankyrin repeat protein